MTFTKPSKRDAAKFALRYINYLAVSSATAAAITHPMDDETIEEYETPISLVSMTTGWYVSAKAKPATDAVVDRIADRRIARKAKKAEEKTPQPVVA